MLLSLVTVLVRGGRAGRLSSRRPREFPEQPVRGQPPSATNPPDPHDVIGSHRDGDPFIEFPPVAASALPIVITGRTGRAVADAAVDCW